MRRETATRAAEIRELHECAHAHAHAQSRKIKTGKKMQTEKAFDQCCFVAVLECVLREGTSAGIINNHKKNTIPCVHFAKVPCVAQHFNKLLIRNKASIKSYAA